MIGRKHNSFENRKEGIMEPATVISGFQPLSLPPAKRPSVTQGVAGSAPVHSETGIGGEVRAGGEAPPSGLVQSAGQNQTVGAANNAEKSGFSEKKTKPDKDQVTAAVKNMNDFLQMVRRTLQFTVDEDSGEMVVQIKDAQTNQVIRQIPSEEMLKLAKQLDKLKGLLFEDKV
jgi:flagellar protein FlaG